MILVDLTEDLLNYFFEFIWFKKAGIVGIVGVEDLEAYLKHLCTGGHERYFGKRYY